MTQSVLKLAEQHSLEVKDLSVGYGQRLVLENVSTHIPRGKVTSIIGPNGCGKSTLLKTMARLLGAQSGSVLLDDEPIESIKPKALARVLGLLPQSPTAPEGITVLDLVMRGRQPHQNFFGRVSTEDINAVDQALAATRLTSMEQRAVNELSGGQRQRAWIALALAQNTDILLLDEPTTYLDIAHQLDVLDLLAERNTEKGTTIAMVLHDINLAARYSDHLIVMKAGSIVAEGTPADVMTAEVLQEVFGIRCELGIDPVSGAPMMTPLGRTDQ